MSLRQGEMVEWSITVVLKTTVPRGTGGSNPSLSAKTRINPLNYSGFSHFRKQVFQSDPISNNDLSCEPPLSINILKKQKGRHKPPFWGEPLVGFEPTTPRLQITCSGQLS